MSMDQNLMGLGMPAPLAVRVASGGTGPIIIASGTGPVGTKISGKQFITFVNSGGGTVTLPAIGGSDNAPELGDDFVIHNGLGGNLTIAIPTGTTVNIAGAAQTGTFTLTTIQTVTLWVVGATQWFGLKN